MAGEAELEAAVEHADDDEVLRVAAARTEAFDAEMKERLRAGVDRFDEMVAHEEGIRLGDAGWKERYYKVRAGFVSCPALACGCCCMATLCACAITPAGTACSTSALGAALHAFHATVAHAR